MYTSVYYKYAVLEIMVRHFLTKVADCLNDFGFGWTAKLYNYNFKLIHTTYMYVHIASGYGRSKNFRALLIF